MAKYKKRADGRYQRRITLSDGTSRLVYGRTLAALDDAAQKLLQADRDGIRVGDTTTVDEWAHIWITSYKANLRAKTISMYTEAYNVHIMPVIGKMPLKEVRPVQVRKVMAQVSDMSDSLQHKVLITMRQIFETAKQNRLIPQNPTDGIKTTPHARPERKWYLTMDEAQTLMERVTEPRARAFCALCLYAGLRREEALGLRWCDVYDDRIHVRRAVTFIINKQDPVHELKTKAAARTIPAPSALLEILAATPHVSESIITNADGSDITGTGFKGLWKRVAGAVDFEVRPHMLRHTYATMLYKANVDLRTAQKLLGHSSIQMTANIYTHVEDADTSDVGARIDALFASSANK